MATQQYTNEELAAIGSKVVRIRERQREASLERRKIKSALYRMYVEGKLGDIKV